MKISFTQCHKVPIKRFVFEKLQKNMGGNFFRPFQISGNEKYLRIRTERRFKI